MKWIVFFLFGLICTVESYEIPSSIRFTLDREESSSPLVYYFSPLEATQNYPIVILCEGSSSKRDLGSVFFMWDYFAEKIKSLQVGFLAVEKWGIDGNLIDENEFWSHYTRSQRLVDHLKVIRHLEQHPPAGWNGELIFIGVSEGGPLVTDLSAIYPKTLATINWVGAGAWQWADEFWHFFTHQTQNSLGLAGSLDIPATREEFDILVQEILSHPTPDQWMGGMTYLYHADAFQRQSVDYRKIRSPFLVVEGTEDSTLESCDKFVQEAKEAGVPITYFRIEGMDHWLRKRPDVIDQSFDWLKNFLKTE